MPRWFRFSTIQQSVLKIILEDDVQTTESYRDYMDSEEAKCFNAGDQTATEQVMEASVRKAVGESILEQLERGGEQL